MRKKIRYLLNISIFIVVFITLFHFVQHVLVEKSNGADAVAKLYKQKKDSIDVVFVGSSHSYKSFIPMELWNEYGITSYNLGTSSQSIPCSYYLIKEAIREQHPKVIVLETYGATYDELYVSEERLHGAVDAMRWNSTKIELYNGLLSESIERDNRLEYMFPIIRFHSRWNEITAKDISGDKDFLKGARIDFALNVQEEPMIYTDGEELYEGTLRYFDKIVELCDEENVELILCQVVMANGEKCTSAYKRSKTLMDYASKKGLFTIDLESCKKELDIDYSKDFSDYEHVNVTGAMKVTSYVGNILTTDFDIPNHKGDSGYENWDSDYSEYKKWLKKRLKKMHATTPDEQ